MYGARVNKWVDKEGSSFNYTSIERSRKVYLSPDVDLTRIHTRSKFLRSMFFILNMVKIPAPSLVWKSSGGIKVGIR
jgi:hypothetical protein